MPLVLQNFYKDTLKTDVTTTGACSIYVTTAKPTVYPGYLVLSPNSSALREIVYYTSTGTDATGDYVVIASAGGRGLGGTTAKLHGAKEPVRMNITAQHWADIFASPTFTGTVTVPTPVNNTDAVTKAYADALSIAGAADSSTTAKGISRMSVSPDVTIGTATMTIATPAVVSFTAHGLTANDMVKFSTSGALPTGVVAGTTYYVMSTGLTADAFQISATAGGSAINTTGSQSGVHTLVKNTPVAVGANDTRLPTQDENDAFAGTSGTPSGSNKFVTNSDVRLSNIGFFGSGSDGDVVISADTTLTKDMNYDDLTINSTFTLYTAGYKVFVKGILTQVGTGKLSANGGAGGNGTAGTNGAQSAGGAGGAGGTAGAAIPAGSLPVSKAGLAGGAGGRGRDAGNASVAGANNGNGTSSVFSITDGTASSVAGAGGGTGGSNSGYNGAAGGTGGTAGSVVSSSTKLADKNTDSLLFLVLNYLTNAITHLDFNAGNGSSAGGGGGGGGASGNSAGGGGGGAGGGGGSGGIIFVSASSIVTAGNTIATATGGTGGNGGAGGAGYTDSVYACGGGGGGGGSGGNGGIVYFMYKSLTGSLVTSVTGGTGGTGGAGGAGAAAAGTAGTAGTTGVAGISLTRAI